MSRPCDGFFFLRESSENSIDLLDKSNLARVMRRIIYRTVAITQKPSVVQVANTRLGQICRAMTEHTDRNAVTYGKNRVIEGLSVVGSCIKGSLIPTSLHSFHFLDIYENI